MSQLAPGPFLAPIHPRAPAPGPVQTPGLGRLEEGR